MHSRRVAWILIIEEDEELRGRISAALRPCAGVGILACGTVEEALAGIGDTRASVLVTAACDRFADPWIRDVSGQWVALEALVDLGHRDILQSRVVLYRAPLDELALLREVRALLAPIPFCP
jgi:hypothetical protein